MALDNWTKKRYHIKYYQLKKRLDENNVVFLVTKKKFYELVKKGICEICEQKKKVITLDCINPLVFTDETVYAVCQSCQKRRGKQEYKIPYNIRIK